jgi:hypothetical protein
MVNARRDKPQVPTDVQLEELRKDEAIARFLDAGAAAES